MATTSSKPHGAKQATDGRLVKVSSELARLEDDVPKIHFRETYEKED